MEKYYYLVNGTVKVSDIEYPTRNMFPKGEIGTVLYNDAFKEFNKYSKPCEIDESELDKVKDYFKNIDFWDESKIADITELIRVVNESYTHNGNILGKCSKIYLKQPTEKQVDSGIKKIAIEYSDKVNIEGATSSSISEAFEAGYKHCKEQPKQVESDAVNIKTMFEFTDFTILKYIRRNGMYCHKHASQTDKNNWITIEQLYEIFKNR